MGPRCSAEPCFIPPHPDLLARRKTELLNIQGTVNEDQFKAQTHALTQGDRTGVIPGLNDGAIFPKSHFQKSVSFSAMSRAALERAPLQGAIRSFKAHFTSSML